LQLGDANLTQSAAWLAAEDPGLGANNWISGVRFKRTFWS
jgi:hypothetical protein